MFDYRRIALWVAVLVVPGGILLLPMLLADMGFERGFWGRLRHRTAAKGPTGVSGDDPKTPNDGPESTPRSPRDGTSPRLAA
jgi:hypothetical protein